MKQIDSAVPRLALKVPEAAAAVGASVAAIYEWTRTGRLAYIRLPGGSIRIPVSALEKLIAELLIAKDA